MFDIQIYYMLKIIVLTKPIPFRKKACRFVEKCFEEKCISGVWSYQHI